MHDQPQKVTPGNVIQVDDIRHFIMDRTAEDNQLDLDLYFSDEEIIRAMRYACMSFNAIPPYTISVSPDNMPFQMPFILGTVYHLLFSKYNQLIRNDIDYQAGGVSVNLVAKQIAYLKDLFPYYKREFDNMSKEMKVARNISDGYAIFC